MRECADFYRRIIFIAVIPLIRSKVLRATTAFMIAVAWALTCRECAPFLDESTNFLLTITSWQISLTIFGALIVTTNSVDSLGLSDADLAIVLLILNLVSSVIVFAFCMNSYRHSHLHSKWRRLATEDDFERVKNAVLSDQSVPEIFDSKSEGTAHGIELSIGGSEHAVSQSDSGDRPLSAHALLEQYLVLPHDVELVKRIGSGSFGEVFQGLYRGESVAVKQMLEFNEKNAGEFRKEILFTANLRHANIVNFVAACWSRELIALIVEWAPKGTLGDMLGDPDLELNWSDTLLPAARDVASGMQYLHHGTDHGVLIHRDLKPDNCLLTDFLRVKVSDFGTSRAISVDNSHMTAVGTPLFCTCIF